MIVFVAFRGNVVSSIFSSYEDAEKWLKDMASHAIFKDEKFYIQEHTVRSLT